ncbi:MAG TPA: cytochrome C oxidase subunit IV family protein [Thermoanaerobaculia bacterium]|jgi:cytochrome c oxidase subunit 4|nr:cytochrome C oxidase subunit IV family protein [Thermoanaerobaculia bacterium]
MTEHVEHSADHGAVHDGHDDSPEAVRKEIRRYLMVLGALGVLTLITVAISQLKLPTGEAIALGLAVATIKGTLVALFFMHLISERKLIFGVLAFTVFFFAVLLWGPWHHHHDAEREWPGHDATHKPAAAAPANSHGSSH